LERDSFQVKRRHFRIGLRSRRKLRKWGCEGGNTALWRPVAALL
jgi:hypothetical protein